MKLFILIAVQYKQVGILVLAWLTMATVEAEEVEAISLFEKREQ